MIEARQPKPKKAQTNRLAKTQKLQRAETPPPNPKLRAANPAQP